MNYRFVFFVGTFFDRNGKFISYERLEDMQVHGRAKGLELFGGMSTSDVNGTWKTSDTPEVSETSWRIEIIATGIDAQRKAREFASFLRNEFEQSCVLLTMEPLEAVLYVNE